MTLSPLASRPPGYSIAGFAVMAISEAGMLAHVEPFWSWHTPIAWTGYILFVDGLVFRRRGRSWLTSDRVELAFVALVSVPLWIVFEGFNLYIRNWHYVNLPENALARNFGYAWSFATIWPAIFETADLVAALRAPATILAGGARSPAATFSPPRSGAPSPIADRATSLASRSDFAKATSGPRRSALREGGLSPLAWVSILAGAAMLIWPLVWPSQHLAAPVWLGFIFLLDPINRYFGAASLADDVATGRWTRVVNLSIAGLICGIVWEFWNYWARTKWIYTVPILLHLRIFEMPVLGYLGFPAFALECFTMYVAVRLWVWPGRRRAIAL